MNEWSDGVVTLSRFASSDAPVMCDGDRDAEIRKRFGFPADFVPSITHSEQVILRWDQERVAGTRFVFAVRETVTAKLLGGCELRPLGPGVADVSYWTYPAHRNKGAATRAVRLLIDMAFGEFEFHTLEVSVDSDNLVSRRIATSTGFEETSERDGRVFGVRRATAP